MAVERRSDGDCYSLDAMKAYHHGDLRNALLAAALEVVDAEGVEALGLRRVAREAGVSHAAPSHHFRNRRGLLAAVAARGFEGLLAAMRDTPEGAGETQRLKAVGVGYVRFAMAHPHRFRVMFHPSLADREALPALDQAYRATFAHVVDVVRLCQDAQLVRPGPPARLARLAWSAVHGVSVLAVENLLLEGDAPPVEPVDATTLADEITTDLFFGLRP